MSNQARRWLAVALVLTGCCVLAGDFLRGVIAFGVLWAAEEMRLE